MKCTLAPLLAGILLAAAPPASATEVVLVLDPAALESDSYSAPFGAGNGVYLAAPDGTPPANDIPWYLWPGGVEEALDANVAPGLDGTAPAGTGAWQSTVRPANDGKVEVLFDLSQIFGDGTYTLADLRQIRWGTNKPDSQTNPDWYVTIWLDAGGGNVAFLMGEPYWAESLAAPPNVWNSWTASETAGGVNEIAFHEPGFACTAFGWSSPADTMPTLSDLVSGSWTWNNVPSQSFLPGCAGTPNPLTTTIDYSTMPVLGLGIATGNPWAGPFTGKVDDLRVVADHPSVPGRESVLRVDFEPAVGALDPATVDKSFDPSSVPLGVGSTMTLSFANPNPQALGGLSLVDTFPAGLEIASPPNLVDTCGFEVSGATAGSTELSLSGGSVEVGCEVSVDVIATGPGIFANTTGALTDTTRAFPAATGTDTASATLTVVTPDLAVTKSPGAATAIPGGTVTFVVEVSNVGLGGDPAAGLVDVLPSALTCSWTSMAQGGASGNTPSGSGDLAETLDLPAGSSVTYALDCEVDPAATGTLSNTATASSSGADGNASNDADTAVVTLVPTADLVVTKSVDATEVRPGDPLSYVVVLENEGPSTEPSARLVDELSEALDCSWTSSASGGATGNTAAGTGDLDETLLMPPGAAVTYVLDCITASDFFGSIENTASAGGSVTDPTPTNDVATAAVVEVVAVVVEIPVGTPLGLGLLAALIGLLGVGLLRVPR